MCAQFFFQMYIKRDFSMNTFFDGRITCGQTHLWNASVSQKINGYNRFVSYANNILCYSTETKKLYDRSFSFVSTLIFPIWFSSWPAHLGITAHIQLIQTPTQNENSPLRKAIKTKPVFLSEWKKVFLDR